VLIDPQNSSTLYAATATPHPTLLKTTDGGRTWSPANSGLANSVFPLAIDPQNTNTVFAAGCAAGSMCGVTKSTDGGTSWGSIVYFYDPSDYDDDYVVSAIAIDPRNSNTVYAITQDSFACDRDRLPKSVDGGVTWSGSLFKDMGVLGSCVADLVVDPQNSRNLYAAFQVGGVFKSTDAGATWNAADAGLPSSSNYSGNPYYSAGSPFYSAIALAIDPGNPSTVYTVSFSSVFKSSDGGMSWNPANSGLPDLLPDWSLQECCFRPRLAVDPQNSVKVYLGIFVDGAPHVFQSSDGGASWMDSGLVASGLAAWFGGLAISSQGTVYAGSPGQGVFAFRNAGRPPGDPRSVQRISGKLKGT